MNTSKRKIIRFFEWFEGMHHYSEISCFLNIVINILIVKKLIFLGSEYKINLYLEGFILCGLISFINALFVTFSYESIGKLYARLRVFFIGLYTSTLMGIILYFSFLNSTEQKSAMSLSANLAMINFYIWTIVFIYSLLIRDTLMDPPELRRKYFDRLKKTFKFAVGVLTVLALIGAAREGFYVILDLLERLKAL